MLLLLLQVKGGPWEACGIGTAVWTGPLLADVLAAAGVNTAALLQCYEAEQQQLQQQLLQRLHAAAAAPAAEPESATSTTMTTTNTSSSSRPDQQPTAIRTNPPSDAPESEPVRHVWFEG
jgi:Tfp pilus assembly protein PilV